MTVRSVGRLRAMIKQGIERGEIRDDIDPASQAVLILGTLRATVAQWWTDQERVELTALRDSYVSSIAAEPCRMTTVMAGTIEHWAREKPDAVAIIEGDRSLTYAAWNEAADRDGGRVGATWRTAWRHCRVADPDQARLGYSFVRTRQARLLRSWR